MNLQSVYIILLMTIAINCSAESNKVAILYSDVMLEHRTGENHPEKPERLSSAVSAVKKNNALSKYFIWPAITKASNDYIQLAHTDDYINLVKSEVERLDGDQQVLLSTGDVVISKDSDEAARFAVGAGIAGIDQIMAKKAASAFALVRPPGHHATSTRGMGFCVYNNIAVAAKYLQKEYGLKRILIVDYDVHHGNGTQDIFYSDESVFYFSVHQHPFYPGTGRENETGQGKGKGGDKGKGKGFQGSCYICGQWGHSAKYCPKGKGKGGEGKPREEDHAERMVCAVSTLLFAISRALRALEMRRP